MLLFGDGAGPGQFSKQGRKENHREAAAAATDRLGLGIPPSRGGTEGSGVNGDKEVSHKEAEQSHAIY